MQNPFSEILPSACPRCLNTGIWLTPRREPAICPEIQLGRPHVEPNAAALLLRRAANRQVERRFAIRPMTFDVARVLTNFVTGNPCPRRTLDTLLFADTNFSPVYIERRVKKIIADLRDDWHLPVGSRKHDPHGYWIITDLDDFKTWYDNVKSGSITFLTTVHKVAKHNFPVFAEQMELEFWRDMKD